MREIRSVVTVLFAAALVLLSVAEPRAENRIALVIGNSQYESAPLKNPRNDATLMADTLEKVGFDVTRLFDADQRTMKRAMIDFGRKLRGSDSVGLFYYAGHGVQVDGENYLIPIGALISDELEVSIEAVAVNEFLRTMQRASSRINIVVLDACRNNPYAQSFRSTARGLARVDAPKGTYVAYATSPGAVALDGSTGHSPYTTALSNAILLPGKSIEQVFKQARRDVLAVTGERQTPWETSSITGRFYFVRPQQKADTPPKPATKDNTALELAYWNTIKDSKNTALLQSYLRQYPTGVFADLAKVMIEQIESATPEVTTSRSAPATVEPDNSGHELVYWDTVKDSDDPVLLNSYLRRFPNGVFSDLARVLVDRLEKEEAAEQPPAQEPVPLPQAKVVPPEAPEPDVLAKAKPQPAPDPQREPEAAPQAQDEPAEEVEIAALEPEPVDTDERAADPNLPRRIQVALSNAGCNPGKVDGVWGRKSSAALALFARYAKANLPDEEVSEETMQLFDGISGRVCPLVCGRGTVKKDGKCVAEAVPAKQRILNAVTPTREKRRKKVRCASYGCEDVGGGQKLKTEPRKKKVRCASYGCDDD